MRLDTHIVQHYMHRPPITVHLDDTVVDAAKVMILRNIGAVIVVDNEGRLCGIVTERTFMPQEDLVPFMRGTATRLMGADVGAETMTGYYDAIEKVRAKRMSEVMDSEPHCVAPDSTVEDVIRIMSTTGRNHVPVVQDGKPVGMMARHDLLWLFSE